MIGQSPMASQGESQPIRRVATNAQACTADEKGFTASVHIHQRSFK